MTARLFIFICNHKGPDRLDRIRYICDVFLLGPFFFFFRYIEPRANKAQFGVTKELFWRNVAVGRDPWSHMRFQRIEVSGQRLMSSDCLTVAWINRMRHNIVNITMGAEPSETNGMRRVESPRLTESRIWNVGKIESLFEDVREDSLPDNGRAAGWLHKLSRV